MPRGSSITRRRGVRAEESEESPRRGRGRSQEEEPEESGSTRGRGSRLDRTSGSSPNRSKPVSKGWASAKKNLEKTKKSQYNDKDEFRVEEGEIYLIKPLEDGPFGNVKEHWVKELAGGKQSWTCEEPEDEHEANECPVCNHGLDDVKAFSYLNIIDLNQFNAEEELVPVIKWWRLSADPMGKLLDIVDELEDKNRSLGDSDVYLKVTKKKSKRAFEYGVTLVKARDLPDDWDGLEPLSDEELDELAVDSFDESVIRRDSHSDLREMVRELED